MLRKIMAFVLSSTMMFSSLTINNVFAENEATSVTTPTKVPAFNGAEGGGMWATGVRGAVEDGEQMEVYHVTNLNDSGAGSFRDAVKKGNRIIVFDVAGNIDLASNVNIGGNNVTILGQTAPGDGICFRGNNIKVSGENIILRYLRFRVGDKLADGSDTKTQDGLELPDNTENVIIDHCSVSWGTDENFTAYAVKDVTIQNCIIAEALNQSIHSKGEHSYAGIWGGVNLTVHHNLIATHKSRNPKIGTSETTTMTSGYTDDQTVVDIRNNVFYNWGDKAGYGAENGAEVNIINNWYKPGPSTPTNKRARIFEYSIGNKYIKEWSGKVYANGNFIDVDDSDAAKATADIVNANNYQPELKTGVYPDPKYPNMIYENLENPNLTYFNDYPVNTTSAKDAYDYVIANAGARLPKMDAVDQRIVDNVVNRTAPNGSKGSIGLVDSPADGVPASDAALYDDRGYPKFEEVTRASDFDADQDGIADAWEDKMGLDKTNPNDSLNIGPEGYTWLEIYVEQAIENASNTTSVTQTIEKDVISKTESEKVTVTVSDSSKLKTLEVYCDDKKVKEETVTAGQASYEISLDNLSLGENYVTVKAINEDGTFALSNVKVIYVLGADYSGSDFTVSSSENAKVFDENGEIYLYSNGANKASLQKTDITDDFNFVANIAYVSNLNNGTQTGISLTSETGKYIKAYKTYENNALVLKTDVNGTVATSSVDANKANMLKMTKEGDNITLYAANSAATWTEVAKITYTELGANKCVAEAYTTSIDGKATISEFESIKFITSENVTHPAISIVNLKDNQKIGFNEDLIVKVAPDSKANINEIAVLLNDKVVKDIFYEEGISAEKEITIGLKFSEVTSGTLKVVCFDENLGMAESAIDVAISADITPWVVTNIGGTEDDMATYVQGTTDYTYKIYAPDGNISGTSDKYGYVYQKFNHDMRICYRSRVQSSKNFGIMLKDSLDADGVSYYFGSEPSSNEKGYTYSLKARKTKGGEYETIQNFANMTSDRYYPVIEKEGNKLKIYLSQQGSDLYKVKELIVETETTLGDEYYMGFAATVGTPDAGWIGIESITKGNNKSYKWNMDYGLDWCWQMQESAILAPKWSKESIGGNETGKMVIAPDADYSERFLMREYTIDQGVVENTFDVFLTGEKPAIDFFLQTALGTAHKVGFNADGTVTFGGTVVEGASYVTSEWYKVKIASEIGTNVSNMAIYDSSDNLIAEMTDVPNVQFASINNTQFKTAIKQGFYIKPVNESQGTYYVDNMFVYVDSKSSLKNAIDKAETLNSDNYSAKTWVVVNEALKVAKDVYADENALEADILNASVALEDAIAKLEPIKGEIIGETVFWNFSTEPFTSLGGTISGTKTYHELTILSSSASTIDGSNKTFDDGQGFSQRMKLGKQKMEIKVDGRADIKVYALSASSKENRNLVISDGTNTQKYLLGSECKVSEFSYTGSTPTTITIYGESGLNYYGVKYTPYINIDTATKITEYDKTTGVAKFFNGSAYLTKAVMAVVVTDNDGKVLEVKTKEFDVTAELEEEQTVEVGTVSKEGNVKVLLWDGFENMKPLCNAYKVR